MFHRPLLAHDEESREVRIVIAMTMGPESICISRFFEFLAIKKLRIAIEYIAKSDTGESTERTNSIYARLGYALNVCQKPMYSVDFFWYEGPRRGQIDTSVNNCTSGNFWKLAAMGPR
jgi:hypothetical protein